MRTVAEHLSHHASLTSRKSVYRADDEIHAEGARKAAEVLEREHGGSHPGPHAAADDPLTSKGEKIMGAMKEEYGPEKGEQVFYASANKGKITGVHDAVAGEIAASPTGHTVTQGRRAGT